MDNGDGGTAQRRPVVALVGHCGPDAFALQSAVTWAVKGVRIERIDDLETLEARRGEIDLALVNRVLDGRFGRLSGHELIARLVDWSQQGSGPRAMLISNFAEAQEEAERLGAAPGFGKQEMRSERAATKLAEALAGVFPG